MICKLLVAIFFPATVLAGNMVNVIGGTYKPILAKGKTVAVNSFLVDETSITNQQYMSFVKANSQWRRGQVVTLFADKNYLKHWSTPENISNQKIINSPVVNVSWFAARAYCAFYNKRLPTGDEWEYMAQFGPTDQSKNVKSVILDWYSKPTPEVLATVKSTFKNKFGVWDVHGLIWEWTEDFNTTFITGESRGDVALEKSFF